MKPLIKKIKFSVIIVSILISFVHVAFAQDTIQYSLNLQDVVSLAIEQSSDVKYAQNTNVNYYWRYKNYKTQNMPKLVLSGDLPSFVNSIEAVSQDNGSTEFRKVHNLTTSAKLSLAQSIALTGTYISASTSATRFQDYIQNSTQFNGSPLSFSFYQPIFAINWLKWQKKTEPLVYNEAQRSYIETIESISLTSVYRFFRFLLVQTNYNLAESNLKNSTNNLKIAQTKKDLGTISENGKSI